MLWTAWVWLALGVVGANGICMAEDVPWRTARHQINQLGLVVSDRGLFGTRSNKSSIRIYDAFTGEVLLLDLEYPRGSKRNYLLGASLWVGSKVRGRPVVSNGQDGKFWTLPPGDFSGEPDGESIRRLSGVAGDPEFSPEARAEEDIVTVYTDTVRITPPEDVRLSPNQRAQRIQVTQRSMAWSIGYLEDLALVEFAVKNMGSDPLRETFIGLYVEPSCGYDRWQAGPDDVVGYLKTVRVLDNCYDDTINSFWFADNDGDPYLGSFIEQPVYDPIATRFRASQRGIMGIQVLDANGNLPPVTFNWWGITGTIDAKFVEPCRLGPWKCDEAIYYVENDEAMYERMANGEFDFNPLSIGAVVRGPEAASWRPIPESVADSLSVGGEVSFLISWGPFHLRPGASVPLTLAIFGGENLHTVADNLSHLPQAPDQYYRNLDFRDFTHNGLLAQWVYDNPGIDTDGDGYYGEFRVCVRDSVLVGDQWVAQKADTQWYKGDGIPDYRGALPPPAPFVWVTPIQNGLKVRFNGQVSETEKDIFLQKPDFEGYRVYLGRDERATSLSVAASFDREDYDKYCFDKSLEEPDWKLMDEPFSKEQLRCLYGLTVDPCTDSAFEPLQFSQLSPYRHPLYPNDSIFWFRPHDYNASAFGVSTPITKIYPEVPDPRLLPADSITEDMYTEDGYLKFYEYECTIENILPTVGYCVSVTAFDYGSPAMGVTPLESDRTKGVVEAFPLHELDLPLSGSDEIYVYPNPYRLDVDYRGVGLEGRNQDDRWDERVRAIWFANLPAKCTIHIFTLDGDRVRTIEHDLPVTDPTHRRHHWDLINRNFQKVETGLYYWVVEVPGGKTQVGKLALIR